MERGWLGRSLCSRNARSRTPLVGRAQLGSSQPPLSERSTAAALLGGPFEHPVRIFFSCATYAEWRSSLVSAEFSMAC
ncbi:MAG: hypothetical protein RL042_1604 [Nitrospirota bacterium]|jgi:hypothetical protein